MDEIVQYLTGIPAWYLATIDAADPTQPRVRPFSFAAQANGKLWFSTSRDKDVWRELEANAKFELSGWKPGECWIVVEGEAELADDEVCPDEVRQAGFKHMVGIGEHHDSPNDGRSQPARPPHTSLQPHVNQSLPPIARRGDWFIPRATTSPLHHFSFDLVSFIFVKSRLNCASGIIRPHGYNN